MLESKELYSVFEEIGINTGKLSKKQINEWQETDDPAMKNFLDWFVTFISKDNVVPAEEQEPFNNLSSTETTLTGTKYKHAVDEIARNHPGIFNLNENLIEMEVIQDELALYQDDALNLDLLIHQHRDLNKKIKSELATLTEQECRVLLKEKQVEKECLDLADTLEEINCKYQKQVVKYIDNLSGFDCPSQSKFLTNMQLDFNINFFKETQCGIVNVLKSQQSPLIFEPLSVTLFNKTGTDDTFEEMQNRIQEALLESCILKCRRDSLAAVLKYLEQVDLLNLSARTLRGNNLYQTETLLITKREQLNEIENYLESVTLEVAKKHINLPKLFLVQKDIKQSTEKLLHLRKVDDQINVILKYIKLLLTMLEAENEDIKFTDKFFLEIFQYGAYNLTDCQTRSKMMLELIQSGEEYESKSIQDRYKLLDEIYSLLTGKENTEYTFNELVQIVRQFHTECENAERKMYVGDFDPVTENCNKIDADLNAIKKLFVGQTTASMIIVPFDLIDLLKQLEETLINFQSTTNEYMLLPKEANKKLSDDKWFRMRRQLWMYFLQMPKKVQACIVQIEEEFRRRQNDVKLI